MSSCLCTRLRLNSLVCPTFGQAVLKKGVPNRVCFGRFGNVFQFNES